jgi:hypothetical protein
MNKKHDPLEEELNAIRVKLYEQTKDMTTQEQTDFFNNRGREILARHGIKAKIVEMPIIRRQGRP